MDDWTLGVIPAIVLLFVVLGIWKHRASRREQPSQWVDVDRPVSAPPADDDLKWLMPPATMIDGAAWDKHWQDQFAHGVGPLILAVSEMFVDDRELVEAMRANGLRSVLCVGNGISGEPRALQWAGFDVTALDLSPFANEVASKNIPSAEALARLVGNRSGGPEGRLEFVAGDLCEPACCPGPYDVVIERRTLQLYRDDERPSATQAVANRLASKGIFVSHCHDGAWKPPAEPRHRTKEWFVTQGWQMWQRDRALTGRVAWLITTTG